MVQKAYHEVITTLLKMASKIIICIFIAVLLVNGNSYGSSLIRGKCTYKLVDSLEFIDTFPLPGHLSVQYYTRYTYKYGDTIVYEYRQHQTILYSTPDTFIVKHNLWYTFSGGKKYLYFSKSMFKKGRSISVPIKSPISGVSLTMELKPVRRNKKCYVIERRIKGFNNVLQQDLGYKADLECFIYFDVKLGLIKSEFLNGSKTTNTLVK